MRVIPSLGMLELTLAVCLISLPPSFSLGVVDNTSHHIMVVFAVSSDSLANSGAPDGGYGMADAGVYRLSPTNGDIVWAKQSGTSSNDGAYGVAIDQGDRQDAHPCVRRCTVIVYSSYIRFTVHSSRRP